MTDICTELPAPRVAAIVEESSSVQYFVLVEQTVLCEAPSFQASLYAMFCAYYVFNLASIKGNPLLSSILHSWTSRWN